jgi:hypothetical protein
MRKAHFKLIKSIIKQSYCSLWEELLSIFKIFRLIGCLKRSVCLIRKGKSLRSRWRLNEKRGRLYFKAVFLTLELKRVKNSHSSWGKSNAFVAINLALLKKAN